MKNSFVLLNMIGYVTKRSGISRGCNILDEKARCLVLFGHQQSIAHVKAPSILCSVLLSASSKYSAVIANLSR